MGWLAGWDKRIKLDIDYTNKIGGSVTWFPVTVFLTSTQGQEVFVELTTDSEYLKVAFTKADGTTELYAEKELFDVSEEKGIFHISRDGWTINADTSIYLYYDKDHADNTTYIGAINTAAGAAVWDDDFKFVCHMVDDNGNVDDSTSNNNDGTKKGAGEPAEAAGKIGQAQDFDGTDDRIECGTDSSLDVTTILTISACVSSDDARLAMVVGKINGTAYEDFNYAFRLGADNRGTLIVGDQTIWDSATSTNALIAQDGWYYIVVTWDGTTARFYVNGSESSNHGLSFTASASTGEFNIGRESAADVGAGQWFMDGDIDEVHFSNSIVRTAAWIKGTYNSLWDSLLTYGAEELPPAIVEFGQWIQLVVNHTKIDAAVSWFPVTVFLSSTNGDCVFDELTADANRFKIAFTKSDRTTQLYAEIEKWDDANESAVIHVSRDGWAISNTVDTVFYMYYDADVEDNTAVYIGDINTTAGENVWDGNFKMVQHMVDATTSTVKDSTSNSNDGAKKGANEPIEATGKVGQAQDFDGNNDYIEITDSASLQGTGSHTLEAVVKFDVSEAIDEIAKKGSDDPGAGWGMRIFKDDSDYLSAAAVTTVPGTAGYTATDNVAIDLATYYHIAGVYDNTGKTIKVYKNAVERDSTGTGDTLRHANNSIIGISKISTLDAPHNGIIDEFRLSSTNRSVAWIKGTYNSLWDALLTYGGEEVRVNALFFGSNF